MLEDILKSKTGFKLVCGAGNEDVEEIEKLVTIYSLAGCNFFDLSANINVIKAAKRGLERAGIKKDRYLCVSVGIKGDPHITKAFINKELCTQCKTCISTCPHSAIDNEINIINKRCIGCGQCKISCPTKAIYMESKIQDYDKILPEIISEGIDCIEFHAISTNEDEVYENWKKINKIFDGMLCISLDRSELGDKKLLERVRNLISIRKEYTTIIQADGIAMSGNNDEYGTTLQAVATAQLFQNSNLPVYIMMSGGTNTKSTELAKMCSVKPNCIAVGSYARKIVNKYLVINDLFNNNKVMNEAVDIAKTLVNKSLEYMHD